MRKKQKRHVAFRGKNKKRWIVTENQLRKMRKDEVLIEAEREMMKENKPFRWPEIGGLIAETAKSVMRFNPKAIVALESRGMPAARLVQYYIQKKTGKKIEVYPIGLIGKDKKGNFGSNTRLVPAKKSVLEDLKEKDRIALIDDVLGGGGSRDKMMELLGESIGKKDKKFKFFYLRQDNIWNRKDAISRFWGEVYGRTPGERAHALAYFQKLRKLVDEQLEKEKQEKK